jgi:hypothetical protein
VRWSPEHRAEWVVLCVAIAAAALFVAELVYLAVMAWGS